MSGELITVLFSQNFIVLMLYVIMFVGFLVSKTNIAKLVFIVFNIFCIVQFFEFGTIYIVFFILMTFFGIIEYVRSVYEN
jgi:hypothetical protein